MTSGPLELFHTGIRVPDLGEAMSELGTGLGVEWAAPVRVAAQPLWTPEHGQQEYRLDFVYSTEGPHHLELLEGQAGSFWDGRDAPGTHHLGAWCTDVGTQAQAMIDAGWTVLAARRSPDEGFGSYAYLAPAAGTIVELVADAAKPRFEAWFAGGSL